MSRLPDALEGRDRAVSAVVGFILIFGILVVTFSLYQATVVPQQNSEVEFEQQQDIQQQMVELRSNIVSMQGSASTLSTTVDLGVRYPSRTIFVNPGPASGSLRTEGASDPDVSFTLRNVEATDSDETGDFWNGTKLNYSTSIIEYEPDYNQFQGGLPVVYEHSLVYNRVENGDSVPITDQSLINGNRINLIALNGTLAENGVGAESIDLEPISTRTRVVEVNNKSGPITLEFASLLNADVWNETLENELVENGGHVQGVTSSSDGPGEFSILELKLDPDRDYELKLSKVGLGTGATDTTAEYLTEVKGAGATVLNDSTQKLTVEARDKFNGPQSGVRVNASAEEGTVKDNRTTDSNGQATFTYQSPNNVPGSSETYEINFTIDSGYDPDNSHDPSTATNVSINVTVMSNTDGSSGTGNGSGGFSVDWKENKLNSSSAVTYHPEDDYPYRYNASKNETLVLNMSTDPSVDEAQVNYAVTNRSRATLTRYTGQTNSSGDNSTTLQPQENGTITVYTYSGGDADELRFNITNIEKSVAVRAGSIVYENQSTGDVTVLEENATETQSIGPSNIKTLGLTGEDLTKPVPYVEDEGNGGSVKITDTDGNTKTLVDGSFSATPNPKTNNTLVTTGTWNGSGPSVFYAGSDNDRLYRVNETGSPEEVLNPDNVNNLGSIKAVMDIGDIDGDNERELVFVDGNPYIGYLNQDGTVDRFTSYTVGSNNGLGAGELVELAGTVWALYVDDNDNNEIALLTDDGGTREETIATSTQVAKSPLTAADVDGDGDEELVFVDTNNEVHYVNNPAGSQVTRQLVDSAGNPITANEQVGVVSADSADSGSGAGSTIPFGDVAFDDANGNGQFDSGEDLYTENDLAGSGNFNKKDEDLIIEKDISADSNNNKIDIKANTTTIRDGVQITSNNGKKIKIQSEYDTDLSGTIINSSGTNADIDIDAGNNNAGDVDANDTVFIYNRDADIGANKGTLYVNNNGGDRADGGTYIEKTDGNAGTIELSKGALVGTPEKGTVDDN